MIFVSDGSGKDFKMTFRWVMRTPEGERVARCTGHSYGKESSLRAEATGMLSALVFIAMVKQYKSNQEKVMKSNT